MVHLSPNVVSIGTLHSNKRGLNLGMVPNLSVGMALSSRSKRGGRGGYGHDYDKNDGEGNSIHISRHNNNI